MYFFPNCTVGNLFSVEDFQFFERKFDASGHRITFTAFEVLQMGLFYTLTVDAVM